MAVQEILFDALSYKCSSRHKDLVAFSFNVGLMLRVLRSAHTNSADVLELKLCMRQLPASGTTPPVAKPFLAFSSKGHNLNLVQDMPVSKPLSATGVAHSNDCCSNLYPPFPVHVMSQPALRITSALPHC